MKKHILVFVLLIALLIPGEVNEVESGDNVVCGMTLIGWQMCQEWYLLDRCDGGIENVHFNLMLPNQNGRYIKIVNPRWDNVCVDCGDGTTNCEWCIVSCSDIYFIDSCAECGEESCEEWLHVKCNVGGYKLYINDEYVLTGDGDGECGVALTAGTYTVKLKKDGCDTVTETARIECGHSITLQVTMNCYEDCDNNRDDDGDGRIDCDDPDCRNDSNCDPCENVSCNPKCYGCDYWATKCDDGECVKDYIIERDSKQCGCGPDPCKEDSDSDGVNNCEDRCPDTPEWMSQVLRIDSEGCLYCLDKEEKCSVAVIFLAGVSITGIDGIILDFCEIVAKLADGDYDGAIEEVPGLILDILIMAAKQLTGSSALKIVDALQTLLTCLPQLSGSELEAVYEESVQMMADEDIDVLSFYVGSPVTVEVTDDRGNTLSESTREIPSSYIFTMGNQKIGLITNPEGEYNIEVSGAGSGTYDLNIKMVEGGKIIYDKKYNDVQTTRGDVNTYNVGATGEKEEASFVYSLPLIIIGMLAGLYAGKKRRKK
jgi:hypothetical protein